MTDKMIKTVADITNIMPIKDFASEGILSVGKGGETELMNKLNALESKYLAELRQRAKADFEAKKRDYEIPTIEEIEEQAARELDSKYDNKSQSLEKDYESTVSKLEADILGVDLDKEKKERNFNIDKHQKEREIYESITKKGLNHSSISELYKENFETGKEQEYKFLQEEINIKKQRIENQIFDAKAKYDLALEGYEIAKAAELKKRITELNYEAEKQSKLSEAINERVMAEEQAYFDSFSQMVKEQDMLDREKGEYDAEKKSNYERRFDLAKEFYLKLDKDAAVQMIEKNSKLKDRLGIYYDRLLKEIKGE